MVGDCWRFFFFIIILFALWIIRSLSGKWWFKNNRSSVFSFCFLSDVSQCFFDNFSGFRWRSLSRGWLGGWLFSLLRWSCRLNTLVIGWVLEFIFFWWGLGHFLSGFPKSMRHGTFRVWIFIRSRFFGFLFSRWFLHLFRSFPKLIRHWAGRMGVIINTSLRQQILDLRLGWICQKWNIIVARKTIIVIITRDYQIVRNVIPWGLGFRRCNWSSKWYSFHPTVEVINWGSLRDIGNWFGGLSSSGSGCWSLLFLRCDWRWARWGGSWSFYTGWWTFWRSYHGLCK